MPDSSIAPHGVTINEDAAYVLTGADFGYSDAIEGNALAAVRIGSIATTGSLRLNGVAVTAGQLVSGANIASSSMSSPRCSLFATGQSRTTS